MLISFALVDSETAEQGAIGGDDADIGAHDEQATVTDHERGLALFTPWPSTTVMRT
jgi:hypothetical protein